MFWLAVTMLGGVLFTMPAALAIVLWLVAVRATMVAHCWTILFLSALALVVMSKVAFMGWGIGIRSLDFTGFSGHAMRACAVMPMMLYLWAATFCAQYRRGAVAAGLVIGILVGMSRIVLHAHSLAEVAAGCILGIVVSMTCICLLSARTNDRTGRDSSAWFRPAVILFAAALVLPFVLPAPSQHWLIAPALILSGHNQPYIRAGWKMPPARSTRNTSSAPNAKP